VDILAIMPRYKMFFLEYSSVKLWSRPVSDHYSLVFLS